MVSPRALRPPAGPIRQMVDGARGWAVWQLRPAASVYIAAVVAVALGVTVAAVATAASRGSTANLGTYLALLGCGVIAVESTRAVKEAKGTVSRDLQTVWYLVIAVTFPPVFAIVAPILLGAYRLIRVRQGFTYRRVFSNATISLAYGAASVAFHAAAPAIAGAAPGAGGHALTWTGLAAGCGVLAWLVNNGLLAGAIHLAAPEARLRDVFGRGRGLVSDLIELSMAVTLALVVAIDPVLMALSLPSVVLYRRSLMNAQLVTQARVDAKTGMLNAATWRSEAEAEVFRVRRPHTPLAVVMVEIDQFGSVEDAAGPEAAGQVLRRIATSLTEIMPVTAQAGRVGAAEFAIVLPGAADSEARRLGERLRDHVAGEPVAIENGGHAGYVFRPTVSVGIAHLGLDRQTLTGLIGAAGSALAAAQDAGGNRVCVAPSAQGGQNGTHPGAAWAAAH